MGVGSEDRRFSPVPSVSNVMIQTSHNWAALKSQAPGRNKATKFSEGSPFWYVPLSRRLASR